LLPPSSILRCFTLLPKDKHPTVVSQDPEKSPIETEKEIAYGKSIKLKFHHPTTFQDYFDLMKDARARADERSLAPVFHYTSVASASLILRTGLRMSTQGQGSSKNIWTIS